MQFPNINAPTGPTGPAGIVGGVQLEITTASGSDVANGDVFAFDTVFANFTPDITNSSGNIQIAAAGIYLVDWWIALDGSGPIDSVIINLVNTDTSVTIGESYAPASIPGLFYGNAIIEVTAGQLPFEMQLINASGNILTLSAIAVQGSIRIVEA